MYEMRVKNWASPYKIGRVGEYDTNTNTNKSEILKTTHTIDIYSYKTTYMTQQDSV